MNSLEFPSFTEHPVQEISNSRWRRIGVWLIVLLLMIAFGACGWYCLTDFRSSEELNDEVKKAFTQREYTRAARLGRTLMTRKGHETAGRFITAKALSHQSDVTEAMALFEQIPDEDPQYGLAARVSTGELLLFRLHRLSAAVEHFHRALRIDPYDTEVHERLSYIYGITNLTWRAVPHRMALLCSKRFGSLHLLLLVLGPQHEENVQSIREYYAGDHNDPLALCAMAHLAVRNNELGEAASHLRRVLELRPEWPEPQALYGTLILGERNPERFLEWQAALPAAAADNSEIWFLKGTFAQEQQDLRGAIRCFAESVRCEPNH